MRTYILGVYKFLSPLFIPNYLYQKILKFLTSISIIEIGPQFRFRGQNLDFYVQNSSPSKTRSNPWFITSPTFLVMARWRSGLRPASYPHTGAYRCLPVWVRISASAHFFFLFFRKIPQHLEALRFYFSNLGLYFTHFKEILKSHKTIF